MDGETSGWLTADEAADLLRCSPQTVKARIKSGDLRATKPAGKWLISATDLDAFRESTATQTRRRRRARR